MQRINRNKRDGKGGMMDLRGLQGRVCPLPVEERRGPRQVAPARGSCPENSRIERRCCPTRQVPVRVLVPYDFASKNPSIG